MNLIKNMNKGISKIINNHLYQYYLYIIKYIIKYKCCNAAAVNFFNFKMFNNSKSFANLNATDQTNTTKTTNKTETTNIRNYNPNYNNKPLQIVPTLLIGFLLVIIIILCAVYYIKKVFQLKTTQNKTKTSKYSLRDYLRVLGDEYFVINPTPKYPKITEQQILDIQGLGHYSWFFRTGFYFFIYRIL